MRLLRHDDRDFAERLFAFRREAAVPRALSDSVAAILEDVRTRGDAAVSDCAERFDRSRLAPSDFRIAPSEMSAALKSLSPDERWALRSAHDAIVDFNRRGLPSDWRARNRHGAKVGEKFDPIRRVGLYVPGGEVPLVSTVLMTATLARIAGCPEVAVFTPARDGRPVAPAVLAALRLVGIREAYRIGGVQAIGAMAYGTASIPPVDKVFGPGNAYVCEAKRQVFGTVGVDSLPGPSELMVIADRSARPDFAASDLLAQAEHGSGRERIYLIAIGPGVAEPIAAEIERQAALLPRSEKVKRVLEEGFFAVQVKKVRQAAEIANAVAPEHLELMVKGSDAKALIREVTTAGAIMVGNDTPTALGDFTAGPSHVLPTGGAGRFFSGLRVADFMRRTSVVEYGAKSVRKAEPVVAAFAAMEQLEAHGRSVRLRVP